jgi:hypothetical protein
MVNIDKIKALAREKGVSITFLCQAIGQGAYYFNDVKRRNGSIPDDRLAVIADLLDTTTEYLTDQSDQKEKPTHAEVDVDELIKIMLNLPRDKKEELLVKFMQMMKEEK